MKEVVKKEILHDLSQAVTILEVRERQDFEQLKELSNHAIENVALHKDLDVVSVAVLLYSIYKIISCISEGNYKDLVNKLKSAKQNLQQNNFGKYNRAIRASFGIVRKCNAKVKIHLQDVMQAARIKKGTALLERGLSIGQAAGLMGLSNWDLQEYAGKTTTIAEHSESIRAKKRLLTAFKIFGL